MSRTDPLLRAIETPRAAWSVGATSVATDDDEDITAPIPEFARALAMSLVDEGDRSLLVADEAPPAPPSITMTPAPLASGVLPIAREEEEEDEAPPSVPAPISVVRPSHAVLPRTDASRRLRACRTAASMLLALVAVVCVVAMGARPLRAAPAVVHDAATATNRLLPGPTLQRVAVASVSRAPATHPASVVAPKPKPRIVARPPRKPAGGIVRVAPF